MNPARAVDAPALTSTETPGRRTYLLNRLIVVLLYGALYGRTLAWGWLGMDDTKVLHQNLMIGPTW